MREPLLTSLLAALLTLAAAPAAAAPWEVRPAAAPDQSPRAHTDNDGGAVLEIYRDDEGDVIAEFVADTPTALSDSSCPTFQIDQREPLHAYTRGETCAVDEHAARFALARIEGPRLASHAVYQLMNGRGVAFRYLTRDGAYHETRFRLTRSKNALLDVLGRDLDVQPGAAPE